MTISRPFAATALSANDAFKLRYPRYLKGAVLAALGLAALFIWLWPGYEATPYQLRQKETCILIDIELEPVVPARWPPSVLPNSPVWPDFQPVEDLEIRVEPLVRWIRYRRRLPRQLQTYQDFEQFFPWSRHPRLLSQGEVIYPEYAQRFGIEGVVILHVRVSPQGRVWEVRVAQPAHPVLDQAAVQAAWTCRFLPGAQRDVPVRTWVAIPYRFRLR